MGFVKGLVKALGEVAEAIEQSNAAQQEKKENETLAHVRGERHDQKYCEICIHISGNEEDEEDEVEELKECRKHEFGECKANCRYRTGVPEDCIYSHHKNCSADCYGRRA